MEFAKFAQRGHRQAGWTRRPHRGCLNGLFIHASSRTRSRLRRRESTMTIFLRVFLLMILVFVHSIPSEFWSRYLSGVCRQGHKHHRLHPVKSCFWQLSDSLNGHTLRVQCRRRLCSYGKPGTGSLTSLLNCYRTAT